MKEKDFINVIELSTDFNVWSSSMEDVALRGPTPVPVSSQALIWQVRAQFAMAQQLTIIAKHLGRIVANAEERSAGSK